MAEAPPEAFTTFDNHQVARPSRVTPAGGGGQNEKHRANRSAAQDATSKDAYVGGSGIVGTSSSLETSAVDETVESPSSQLAKYGAHGMKRPKHHHHGGHHGHGSHTKQAATGGGGTSPPRAGTTTGPRVVHLNSDKAQELERKMMADTAKAAEKAQQQPDAFDAAYSAIAPVQPTAALNPNAVSGGKVDDDDFDF